MRALVAVLLLALAAVALGQEAMRVGTLPESPHQSLYVEGMCTVCHATYLEQMEPHGFVLPIGEICLREACHTTDNLGRSHPVGVDITQSRSVAAVPENFPLENEMISCGSCHQPHGEWLSSTRCFPNQQPGVQLVTVVGGEEQVTPYYKTYYLRVPGDPEEGFTALCTSCHPR